MDNTGPVRGHAGLGYTSKKKRAADFFDDNVVEEQPIDNPANDSLTGPTPLNDNISPGNDNIGKY